MVLEDFALVTDCLRAFFSRFYKRTFSQAKQSPRAPVKVIVPDCLNILFADIPEAVFVVIDPAAGENRTIPVYGDPFPKEITGGVLKIGFVTQIIVLLVVCFVWTEPLLDERKVFGDRW